MTKLVVDGVTIEYEQDDIIDAIEILREDHAIASFGTMKEQQKQIIEWIEEQKKGKSDGDGASARESGGGSGGAEPAESDKPEGSVDIPGSGQPGPPPVITPEEREEQKPPKRKSRWWGDAIETE
jgi:hypothetical protein